MHRFRPAEETWFAETLPAARTAGSAGRKAIRLFDHVLEARDELAAVLPPDGHTPPTRAVGQAILTPMKRLVRAMDAFHDYATRRGGAAAGGGVQERSASLVVRRSARGPQPVTTT